VLGSQSPSQRKKPRCLAALLTKDKASTLDPD